MAVRPRIQEQVNQIGPTSYPDDVDLHESGILQGLAAFAAVAVKIDHGGTVEQIDGPVVTGPRHGHETLFSN